MAASRASSDDRLRDRSGNPLRLLLVHAHPGGETVTTGATAALYTAEHIGVHLVACTRGERDKLRGEDIRAQVRGAPDTAQALGEIRARELGAATTALGISSFRFLGGPGCWWDSGPADAATNTDVRALVGGNLRDQVRALTRVIRELRPQVLVTYNAWSGCGHPDYIRAHELSMLAVRFAEDGAAPDRWTVAKVYAAVVPYSVARRAARRLASRSIDGPNPFGRVAEALENGVPGDKTDVPFGVPDQLVSARIDARDWVPAKNAAMRAHRSQMTENGWFFALSEPNDGGFGVEHFQLLRGTRGPLQDDGLEADLFAGLRAAEDPGCEPGLLDAYGFREPGPADSEAGLPPCPGESPDAGSR